MADGWLIERHRKFAPYSLPARLDRLWLGLAKIVVVRERTCVSELTRQVRNDLSDFQGFSQLGRMTSG